MQYLDVTILVLYVLALFSKRTSKAMPAFYDPIKSCWIKSNPLDIFSNSYPVSHIMHHIKSNELRMENPYLLSF